MPLFWFVVIGFVAMFAVAIYSVMNAPKAPDATVQTGNAPTAEEGRPIPVVFGTVMIRDPNIVWYGKLSTRPITTSGGGKK